ncbi:MAG TPA: hypothetical protein VM123_03275 [archaeon]|nr:hypothetical protein [archaeon]
MAEVIEVLDKYNLVIDRGSLDRVKRGQIFQIYGLSEEESKDSETHGKIELVKNVKGTGEVIKVQEKTAIVRSTRINSPLIVERRSPLVFLGVGPELKTGKEEEDEIIPFDNPLVGDKAEPIE